MSRRRHNQSAALREQSPPYVLVTGEHPPSPGGEGRGEGERAGTDKPTCLDLFCGCGGFTLGMQRAGFRVLAAIDFNDEAIQTFKANFSSDTLALREDLTEFTPEKLTAVYSYGSIEARNDVVSGKHKVPTGEHDFGKPRGPRGETNESTGNWFVPISVAGEDALGLHGGGSGLLDSFAPEQGWVLTNGCIRVQNQDLEWITGLILLDRAAGESSKILVMPISPATGGSFLDNQENKNPFLQ